ncbi:hypothetical protein [uncultured Brevundimonas sp.]|uniref:hypothetical protein n=1 Tax=uncultured Brevundimonas sp. TaxID=213418 RepID=UPI001D617CD7|nr:hypothetical protein [uncultured Brevundimonas sp.]MBU3971777.1 hypothetical protein [Alphaproteobacteria bacterium]MBU4039558.1 hypothetical protein [Alphaproteobacteria bacterium]MBU4137867.1 hypothetical protein [Alphaproteobacteria bacterium]
MAVAADLMPVPNRSFIIDVLGGRVIGLIVRCDVDMIRDLVDHRVDLDQRHGGPIGRMSHAVLRIRHAMHRRHRHKSGAKKDTEGTNRISQTGSPIGIYPWRGAHATGDFQTDRRAGGRPRRHSPGRRNFKPLLLR